MKQTICIQSPSRLSVKHASLIIEKDGAHIELPLEDIWVIILETHQATITASALSAIVDSGIGVMTCGINHMPNGLLLPIGAHSRHSEIVDNQLAMPKPLKKRLWQAIVASKIRNQAAVLSICNIEPDSLLEYANEVRSGDTTARESVAAASYFKKIIPEGTRREGKITAALDYGYAVLRAGIARTAVSGGWLVSRGIHHNNKLNAFNLVDDLIEPFRPTVDLLILQEKINGDLTPKSKALLASVFEMTVSVCGEDCSVQTAIEKELASLRRAVIADDATLIELPVIKKYAKARNE